MLGFIQDSAAAQSTITGIAHFNTATLTMGIVSDSVQGVGIVATRQPGRDARDSVPVIWHDVDPDSIFTWLDRVAVLLRASADPLKTGDTRWVLGPSPGANRGFALGRYTSKGRLGQPALALADSGTGWEFPLTMQEADSLVRLLWQAATVSRRDPAGTGAAPAPSLTPARLIEQPRPGSRGQGGVVLLRYVVDTTGLPEPGSVQVILAGGPRLVEEARRVASRSRFAPAHQGDAAVPWLAQQIFVWRGR
ncbi:MAG TPA: energy transducer TonB [Gemmatimonadales bacterium]|nr:energy transducer TonB [Gemmatimonadales bacterium]